MYALRQALRAIRKNWIASISTLTTMTLSLTILAGFSLLSLNVNLNLGELQNELELAAYLSRSADPQAVLETVSGWGEVVSAELVSPDDALENLITELPYIERPSAQVNNPLPYSLYLRLSDPSQTARVGEALRELPGVDEVEDGGEAVETFLAINEALRLIGSVLIVVLLSSALFAIVNSIRAAITARRDEIEVMRLVGATRGFIRSPFLIEGVFLGLLSALLTLLLVVPGYSFIALRLSQTLRFLPLERDPLALAQLSLLLVALALLVGLVGSAISVSQYLQEDG
ncbi:MAG: Assymetric_cell_division_FstX [uncultured Truepera sp.]|uniref:Cell division protein FtsX n=1 Tax=uncultured Truepera sp. TaxID=543023 RepID=A0A6J4V5J3_9DEIN|nr:MAG: Assymetric_cell_division_FstX [uncultured Truepera sp.]